MTEEVTNPMRKCGKKMGWGEKISVGVKDLGKMRFYPRKSKQISSKQNKRETDAGQMCGKPHGVKIGSREHRKKIRCAKCSVQNFVEQKKSVMLIEQMGVIMGADTGAHPNPSINKNIAHF